MARNVIFHTEFEINFIVNGTIKTLYYRKFIIQVNVFLCEGGRKKHR